MIVIVDYGICNVGSVHNMLRRAGLRSMISTSPDDLEQAERIILPGIGHFAAGMASLREKGYVAALQHHVRVRRKPLLGICLGMHLLARHSEEGDVEGLGLVPANVVKFDPVRMSQHLPIPHMGWAEVIVERSNPIARNVMDKPRFYFVHSYHVVLDDPRLAIMTADYGYPFTAAYQAGNIFGAQFHPEKSHAFGRAFLTSYANANVPT